MTVGLGAGAALALAVTSAASGEGQVIAAAAAIDQSTAAGLSQSPSANRGSGVLLVSVFDLLMLALAMAVLWMFLRSGLRRLHDAPSRPFLAPPLGAIVFFAAFWLLASTGAAAAAQLFGIRIDSPEDVEAISLTEYARLALGQFAGQSIALIALVLFFKTRPPMRIDVRPGPGQAAAVGALTLLLAWPVIAVVTAIAALVSQLFTGEPVDLIAHQTLEMFLENEVDGWTILMAGLVVIAAPVMEEVMYRGLLQGTLVQVGVNRWAAILLCSAFFTIQHGDIASPHALAPLLVLSIALGWVYERTGRLIAPIVMHMLFNAGNLLLALTIVDA